MKQKRRIEVAATIILGIVCVFLVLRLAVRVRAVSAGSTGAAPVARLPETAIRPAAREVSPTAVRLPDAPVLNVALFEQLQSDPLVPVGRDPFSFLPSPAPAQPGGRPGHASQAAQNHPSGPPPPPPVPLKALGYLQDSQGQLQAYLTDSQNIYAVRSGEQFGKVYRVLKITPAYVEIEDESLNLRAQLAIPQ